MGLDFVSLDEDDRFVFKPVLDTEGDAAPVSGSDALSEALVARDIDAGALTSVQQSVLADFALSLDAAQAVDLATADEAAALFGDALDITIVDNLRTQDGAKLHGATTADGHIYLDAGLTGQALTDTLVEELGEAAFYSAFGDASEGDFGAEIAARLAGERDESVLATFREAGQDDTVLTEFGEAQAKDAVHIALADGFSDDYKAANAGHVIAGIYTYPSNGAPTGEDFFSFKPVVDFDLRGINLTSMNGKYDLNNDGVLDQYNLRHVNTDFDSPNLRGGNALYIVGTKPTEIVPTSQSKTVLIGKGEASTTWVLRKEETHTTSKEFNWNLSLENTLSASGKILGVGAEVSATIKVGGGGSTTKTDSFTVANEVRDTYKIPAGTYKEGTLVSYGFHMLTGDVDVIESYSVYARITNARDGYDDHIQLRGAVRDEIKDHYMGIVMTDFDMTNPPNAAELFDIA